MIIDNLKILRRKIFRIIKKILGFSDKSPFLLEYFIYDWHLRAGHWFYKKKFSAQDVVREMQKMGMRSGSVVFIQSRWAEFYNCTSTPTELIEEILKVIGSDGTMAMDCEPFKREGKIYNVKRTPTYMGLLAEAFRKYPGVKRSCNSRHAACAIGAKAEYLISEHHLGETAWDKKSPYYRLHELNGLLFCFGLGKYYQGTIQHCIESLLKDEVQYYHDMFDKEKTEYHYIDYDGQEKTYWNYDLTKARTSSYVLTRKITKKYLNGKTSQISNLEIVCFETKEMLETLLALARKGIDTYYIPSKKGYKFEK